MEEREEGKIPLSIIEEVYNTKRSTIEINGRWIRTRDDRYQNFLEHGFGCSNCGLKGEYALLEYNTQYKWYLNVYGTNKDGKRVQLTKDHIYPKSKGGLNDIKNYQTLCEKCNQNKQDNSPITLRIALINGYATKNSIQRVIKQGRKNALVGV